MKKLNTADVEGKTIIWKDDEGSHEARIEFHIRDGATSSVYKAREISTSKNLAIKIPFPKDDSDDDEFLDEASLVEKLHRAYIPKNAPLPLLRETSFLSQTVIITDFLKVEWQMIARRQEPDFLLYSYFSCMQQIMKLFEVLHDQGFANLDIKDENFYLLPDDRLVVVDWNRCISNDPQNKEKNTRYLTTIHSTHRVLANLFFQFYTGKEPPNPLPINSDSDWGVDCPRAIKRTLIDCSMPWGFDGTLITERLVWQEKIINSAGMEGEKDILIDCRKLHEPSEIDLHERVERILDALDTLKSSPRRADFAQELENEVDWVSEILSRPDRKINDIVEQILKFLSSYNANLALQTCQRHLEEMSRPDQYFPRTVHWKLARWLTICDLIAQLSNSSAININNHEEQIPALLDILGRLCTNPELSLGKLELGLHESVKQLHKSLSFAEDLRLEMLNSYNLSNAIEKIRKAQGLKQKMDGLRGDLSEELFHALEKFLPLWNLVDLEAEVLQEAEFIRIEKERQDLKEKIVFKFENYNHTSLPEIEESIIKSKTSLDEDLKCVGRAIKEARQGRWKTSLEFLDSRKTESTLMEKVKRGINIAIQDCLSKAQSHTLYESDIWQLLEIKSLGVPILEPLLLRLDHAQKAETDSQGSLDLCKKYRIEPWASDADDLPFLVDQLILNVRHQVQKQKLIELKGQIQSDKDSITSLLLTKETVDGYLAQKDEFQKNVDMISGLNQDLIKIQHEIKKIHASEQSPNKILEELGRMSKELGNKSEEAKNEVERLKNQLKLVQEAVNSMNKEFPDTEQALPIVKEMDMLISLTIEYARKGEFDKAVSLWENQTKNEHSKGKSPASTGKFNEIITSWKNHLSTIRESPEKKSTYQKWFEAISQNKAQDSYECITKLAAEKGSPLYEHLLHNHHLMTYGKNWGLESLWWELFKDRKIEDLRKQINEFDPKSGYDYWLKNQWNHRLYLYQVASNLIEDANEQKDMEWIKESKSLLQVLIPADIWLAALPHPVV